MATHAPPNQKPGLVEQARESVSSTAHSAAQTAHQTVDHYPISTALVVFGVGLGAGVLIGCALADANFGGSRSRGYGGNTVEAFGHRILDNIASIMPDAVASHLKR
jgi:hypothetical protein